MATEIPLTSALARDNAGAGWVQRDADGHETASGYIAETDEDGYANLHFDGGGWTNTCSFEGIFLVCED